MSTRTSNKVLFCAALLSVSVWSQAAMAQSSSATGATTSYGQYSSESQSRDAGHMSREDILKTFQREAHAAHAQARQECQAVSDAKERQICLARARLQFDEDMRYAQKRADMGY